MKVILHLTAPFGDDAGRCENCALAVQANDRVNAELQPDGSWWPIKPYPGDAVILHAASELYDHLLEHRRAGHAVLPQTVRKAEKGMRLGREMLKKIREELKQDPMGLEYAGKTVEEQFHLFNNILVPFKDELGNRVGYTSRANLLLHQGVRLADMVMATYNN